jgi:hypothetical protein
MAVQGSEGAHDAKVVELLGDDAASILSRPPAYPPLRVDPIRAALDAGKTCRIKATAARLFVYADADGGAKAVVTELPHSGYRRRYRTFEAVSAEELVQKLSAAYGE